MNVHLLGTFNVESDGEPVDISTRAEQLLLARLAMDPGQPQPRARLAGLLWPESEESQARSNLRHALWRLKQGLGGDFLEAKKETITLTDQDALHIDVREFVDSAGGIESPESLIASLKHYGGELLPGFYEEWVVRERERLTASYERRMGRLLNLLLEEGRYAEMKRWAERWIARGGAPEPAYRGLMNACAGLGDQVGMAVAYERCVQELEEELGVAPSADTVALYERLGAGERPPGAPTEPPKHNLPSPISSFIGRERELGEIADLLADSDVRLLTLTGSPGVGKTRLALEASWRQIEHHEGGVWWIELAPVEAAERVADAIARSIGLERLPDDPAERVERLATSLDRGPLLLVIDNCEHLLDRVASLTKDLLERCPSLTILTTSRRALGIAGETAWEVPGLEVKVVDGSKDKLGNAVGLFTERARQVNRGFELTPQNLPTVIEICHRLDGVALAIELAAARMKSLTTKDLLEQLDRRFDLLRRESTAGDPKQRTLEAGLRWSLELLSEEDREIFLRLSVFRGGFQLELAHEVCSGLGMTPVEIGASVARLVEHSLVTTQRTDKGRIRYGLLETMRQFGEAELERRGILSGAYELHIDAMKSLSARWGPKFIGPDDALYLRRMDLEVENLRVAIDRAIENADARAAADLIAPIHRYINLRGNTWRIVRKAVRYVLEHEESIPPPQLQWVLWIAGSTEFWEATSSERKSAIDYFRRSFEFALSLEDSYGVVRSCSWLTLHNDALGHDEEANKFAALCEKAAKEEGTPELLVAAAIASAFTKSLNERIDSLRKARDLADRHGGSLPQAWSRANLGLALKGQGDWRGALENFQIAYRMLERTGEARWSDLVLSYIAACQARLGAYQESLDSLDRAVEATRWMEGSEAPVHHWEAKRASVLVHNGELEAARELVSSLDVSKSKDEWDKGDVQTLSLRAYVLSKVDELSRADTLMCTLFEEIGRDSEYKFLDDWGRVVWADIDHRRDRLEEALAKYSHAFQTFEYSPTWTWSWFHDEWEALINFAYLLVDLGQHNAAASFLRRTESVREAGGIPVHPVDEARREAYFSRIGAALGDDWLTQKAVQTDLEPIDVVVADAAEIAQRLST